MNSLKGNLLYALNDGIGVFFDKQAFSRVCLNTGQRDLIVTVRPSGVKGLLSRFRLATRLLRMEPRCVERLDGNRFVVCHAYKIWLLNTEGKTFSFIQESRTGFSNPINLCSDGEHVFWGDYGDNAGREAVNIYRLSEDLSVEIVYSFPKGSIRHIHNIVWDESNNRFFILTGDLEESSGIYIASQDWSDVKPLVTGKQQYRAVVGFPYHNGLIYVTDAVEENNNIYLLQGGVVKSLSSFPGSCIYGAETKNHFVFASTVEPPEGRGLMDMFSYKLGAGIKDRYAHLISVRKSDLRIEDVLKVKKDVWPMKLFQYGALMFPKGQEKSDELWYYSMACKGDGKSFMISI